MDVPARDTLRGVARAWSHRGAPVLPLRGKVPRVRGGVRAAVRRYAVIDDWWSRWPDAWVGIACGRGPLRLLVLDVDDLAVVGELRRRGLIAGPPTARTPSGGAHWFFTWPGDQRVPGNATADLPRGVDVRGLGGYVVAPEMPGYRAVGWYGPPPAALVALLSPPRRGGGQKGRARAPRGAGVYAEAAFSRRLEGFANVPEGGRHLALVRLAYLVGGWDADFGVPASWRARLISAGVALLGEARAAEVERAVSDGWERGRERPVKLPGWGRDGA